jgi:hypothetical protein
MKRSILMVLGIGICLLIATNAIADDILLHKVPGIINYQGRLLDDEGNPADGQYKMRFSICIEGRELWSEEHDSVLVTKGIFNKRLGESNPISGYWNLLENCTLDVQVKRSDDTTPWDKKKDRVISTKLTSVPYALVSGIVTTFPTSVGFITIKNQEFIIRNENGRMLFNIRPEKDKTGKTRLYWTVREPSYISVPAEVFILADVALSWPRGAGVYVAPVQLPHRAIIRKIIYYFRDNSTGKDTIVRLFRRDVVHKVLQILSTVGSSGAEDRERFEESEYIGWEVDNSKEAYYLEIDNNRVKATKDLYPRIVVIEYDSQRPN